jgi:hypothetical protein
MEDPKYLIIAAFGDLSDKIIQQIKAESAAFKIVVIEPDKEKLVPEHITKYISPREIPIAMPVIKGKIEPSNRSKRRKNDRKKNRNNF